MAGKEETFLIQAPKTDAGVDLQKIGIKNIAVGRAENFVRALFLYIFYRLGLSRIRGTYCTIFSKYSFNT
jgi:hypothetical protein